MATAPNTAPMGQTFPPRLMSPLVGLNVGLLHTYIDSSLTYAESLLSAVNSDERSILKTAITRGRMALDKASELRKNKKVLTDSKSIDEQAALMSEAMGNLSLIAQVVYKNFQSGTILNNKLIATILTASRTNHGR
jgi:hypothetical protein